MTGRREILQDWEANAESPRMRVFMVLFRLAQLVRRRLGRRHPAAVVVAVCYRLVAESLFGCELPVGVPVGPGLTVHHGFGLVVHPESVIGAGVTLRHGVTIGNTGPEGRAPVIEDGVVVGVGATIVGPIRIGQGASIGAHALVLHDVPAGAAVRAAEAQVRERVRDLESPSEAGA